MSALKIGFVNQKGGVGKTTLGITVCTALSQAPFNKKCCFIDCDAQESAVMQRKKDIYEISEELACSMAERKLIEEGNQKPSENEIDEMAEQYFRGIREKMEKEVNTRFPYPVFYCETQKLMELVMQIEDNYDYIFIDMPGQAQGEGLATLLVILDHAFVPVESGDFDISSSVTFLKKKLFKFKEFKEKKGGDFCLNINLVFNKVKETVKYRDAISSFKAEFINDPRVSIIDEKYCLPDSVFYKENTSTYHSVLDVKTFDKNKKRQQERFEVFVNNILKIIG